MLLLLQAVQQLPPIHVTIAQPSGGISDFAKIMISAATGAVFGIAGNLVMEFIKPRIAHAHMKNTVENSLGTELIENLRHVELAIKRLAQLSADRGDLKEILATAIAKAAITQITSDRYNFFTESQKLLVYEIDHTNSLSGFYGLPSRLKQADSFNDVARALESAKRSGNNYVEVHGLEKKKKQHDAMFPDF